MKQTLLIVDLKPRTFVEEMQARVESGLIASPCEGRGEHMAQTWAPVLTVSVRLDPTTRCNFYNQGIALVVLVVMSFLFLAPPSAVLK